MSSRTLKDRIGSLLDKPNTADVTFVVGEDQERIPAHSLVMSTASDSFSAMFYGGFNRERVVKIPDASPAGFRELLKFIYTDEANITADNVASVLSLADKYLVTDLFDHCVEWVKQHVTAANVCRFLPLAELYNDLSQHCWSTALSNGNEVLRSEYFLDIPKELLVKLFGSDDLKVIEKTVFNRAVDWARRRLEQENRKCDPLSIRTTLGDALYLIRFPLFDAKEFADGPVASGILTDQECVALLVWFTTQKSPLLFSTKARRDAGPLADVDRIIREFGLNRTHDDCDHEAQVEIAIDLLREKCKTASVSCSHMRRHPWICLACLEAHCATHACECSVAVHNQHSIYFNGSKIFCSSCALYIASI